MDTKDSIYILEYPSLPKNKRGFVSILLYIILFVIFISLSSYRNPTCQVNSKLADSHQQKFQMLFEKQIKSLAQTNTEDSVLDIQEQLNKLIVSFYEMRDYSPAWTTNFVSNYNFIHYSNLLDSINYLGFPVDYFNKEKVKLLRDEFENSKQSNIKVDKRIDLELSTSFSALKLMVYLSKGIVVKDSSSAYHEFINTLPTLLHNAINEDNIANQILSLQPQIVLYQDILKSIPHFIDLHRSIKNTTPKFIDDNLLATSLYYTGICKNPVFDSSQTKITAIHKLQKRFQLSLDSVMNTETHQALVSLLDFRYYQACLNLHRLRRLNNSDKNYLFVNIPEFKLHVVESNMEKESFNVIVGTKRTPTPTLSSSIEKLVANPFWTVPKSIANNEMLYKIRRDSEYLKRNGYFVIDNQENVINDSIIDWTAKDPLGNKYWIRQTNSKYNALGQIKFIFPNNYSVYIHDTPNKKLFQRDSRSFSHGCVRLENPDRLAQYLSDRFISQKKVDIKDLISREKYHEIDLSEKVQLHVQYITCKGNKNSEISFYNDIYNLDEKEIKAIFPKQSEI